MEISNLVPFKRNKSIKNKSICSRNSSLRKSRNRCLKKMEVPFSHRYAPEFSIFFGWFNIRSRNHWYHRQYYRKPKDYILRKINCQQLFTSRKLIHNQHHNPHLKFNRVRSACRMFRNRINRNHYYLGIPLWVWRIPLDK